MPIDNSFAPAAGRARRRAAALFAGALLLLGGCAATGPVADSQPPMRVANAPTPPTTAQNLDDAVVSLTVALFDRARIDAPGPDGRYPLVVDPLIDRATGQQSVTTRAMERRISELVRERYPAFEPKPFTLASLEENPLILLGSITPVAAPGVIPASNAPAPQFYRIWAVLGDLRTGRIVSHETAWVRASDVDPLPAAFFRDSPAWTPEGMVAAYLRTCAGNPGDPIDPAYLEGLRTQALVADGMQNYEAGRFQQALMSYNAAAVLPAGAQMRVLNGLYLSNRALGRRAEAETAFGEVVDYGLSQGRLSVKFLFRPGSTAFWPGQAVSGDYPMWLRQIARRADAGGACMDIVGHSSATGPAAVNDRLSLARATTVRRRLLSERPGLGGRTRAQGVGSREPLVGSGTDDVSDLLDRRVEFRPAICPATAGLDGGRESASPRG